MYPALQKSRAKIDAQKGQACLLPPGTVHSLEKSRKGDNIIKTVIPTELFEKCADNLKIGTEMTVFDKTSEQVNFIVMRLLSEYYGGADYSERAVENYLSLLFIELLRGGNNRDEHLADELNHYLPRISVLRLFTASRQRSATAKIRRAHDKRTSWRELFGIIAVLQAAKSGSAYRRHRSSDRRNRPRGGVQQPVGAV